MDVVCIHFQVDVREAFNVMPRKIINAVDARGFPRP